MIVTNHLIAGALIGMTVKHPIAAIVVAFLSHFIMDVIPHFGYAGNKGFPEVFKHKLSYVVGIITIISTIGVFLFLLAKGMWFATLIGIIATSPDIVGWYNYIVYEKNGNKANKGLALLHVKYHRRIQWCERPWGIYIEIIAFTLLLMLLLQVVE